MNLQNTIKRQKQIQKRQEGKTNATTKTLTTTAVS
jgi:hypothetical protein